MVENSKPRFINNTPKFTMSNYSKKYTSDPKRVQKIYQNRSSRRENVP